MSLKSLLCIALLILGATNATAQTSTQGIVGGQLRHELADGKSTLLQNTAVILNIYDGTVGKIVASSRALTDATGNFRFAAQSTAPTLRYQIVCNFGGVDFRTDLESFKRNQQALRLPLAVYDSSSDTSLLSLELLHIGVYADASDSQIQIEETFIVANKSSTAFRSEQGLRLPLPEGTNSAQIIGDAANDTDAYRIEADTLIIAKAITPGNEVQVPVRFYMRSTFGGLKFNQQPPLRMARVGVLLYPSTMHLKGAYREFGEHTLEGNRFRIYIDHPETASVRPVSFVLQDAPGGFGLSRWIMLAALLLIACGIFWLAKSDRQREYVALLRQLKALRAAVAAKRVTTAQAAPLEERLWDRLIELKREAHDGTAAGH